MITYCLCCADPVHQMAALDASSVVRVTSSLPRGADGTLRVVPLGLSDSVPSVVSTCTDCDTSFKQPWPAKWSAFVGGIAWTESEKGVLVPEADGTAALVQSAAATWPVEGGWEVCERLVLASETTIGGNVYAAGTYRIVRYTGTKPAELAAYPYLTAAGVAGAVALKEV